MMIIKYLIFWILTVIAISFTEERLQCGKCFHKCIEQSQCDDYGCKPGYYGNNCTQHCPDNCRDGVSGRPVCSQDSGSCLSGCQPGFYGKRCNFKCSSNCIGKVCCQDDGVCIQGCRSHWYGPQCNSVCNKTCLDRVCDRHGICNDCISGWWGRFCENKCSPNCVGGTCVMNIDARPECSDGCLPGWEGSNCDVPYEEEKRTRRGTYDAVCYTMSSDGHKCECCKSTWRGDNCTINCPNCRSKYFKPQCFHHCKPGFYGEDSNPCNKTCSGTCNLGIQNVSVCDPTTGECSSCKRGHYGIKCQQVCSRCVDDLCDKKTGICLKCQNTRYGDHCEHDCRSTCNQTLCHSSSGSCTTGCIPGKYGVSCTHDCSDKCSGSDCILTSLGHPVCNGPCVANFTGRYCEERCPVICPRCGQKNDRARSDTGANCLKIESEIESRTSSDNVNCIVFPIVAAVIVNAFLLLVYIRPP